ncbi:MAG: ketoacyl-ACP synthase III [Oribacterium sp.]|nr:ketoacyl-ACP synthase III [Oribacterium sp.]MDY2853937.1 ketoacyl-ACP synthase III [Oliverpabstia sp.]
MNEMKLIGLGAAYPGRLVTNDDLSLEMDTSDAWIYPRTGIHARRFCTAEESAVTLAIEAAGKALAEAESQGVPASDIGAIVVASMSADLATPSIAAILQRELRLPEVPALDINAACSGFIYGLEVARSLAAVSGRRYALVVGTEQLSRLLSMEDRSTAILFGDGAGAAVIECTETAGNREEAAPYVRLFGSRGSDVILAPGVYTGAYEAREETNAETVCIDHMLMDGKEVFMFACDIIPRIIGGLLEQSGETMEDIDHVVCHQANARIIRHVYRAMHWPAEKFFMNMEKLGNTSAASIPTALYDMQQQGRLQRGERLILAGFGGGLTWGGCILSYDAPTR